MMNLDSISIEEGQNALPFHCKLETDFWESVSQSNKTVNTHFGSKKSTGNFNGEDLDLQISSVYKYGITQLFTEAVGNYNTFFNKLQME